MSDDNHYPDCANVNPLSFCTDNNYDPRNDRGQQFTITQLAAFPLAYSVIIIVGLLCDQLVCQWARFSGAKQGTTRPADLDESSSFMVLPASVCLICLGMMMSAPAALTGTTWSFGQIVALFVFIPPVLQSIYLLQRMYPSPIQRLGKLRSAVASFES